MLILILIMAFSRLLILILISLKFYNYPSQATGPQRNRPSCSSPRLVGLILRGRPSYNRELDSSTSLPGSPFRINHTDTISCVTSAKINDRKCFCHWSTSGNFYAGTIDQQVLRCSNCALLEVCTDQ